MKADEGLKFEVMQVVSLQIKNSQAVQRCQGISIYLRDVVVAQLEYLGRQTNRY